MSEHEDEPLLFRYAKTEQGGKPIIPLRLTAAYPVVVGASVAPSLPRTVVSPLWAEAAGLSPGGTAVAQVQERMSTTSRLWGPQVIVKPILASELDEATAAYAEADDIDWRSFDACLVGHDFLCNLTVILDGVRGRLILDTANPLSG